MPPGTYTISIAKANFTRIEDQVSILPGSCADLRLYIKPASGVSGRVVDVRGAPVGNTEFMLFGAADPKVLDESIFDSALGSIHATFHRLTGWGRPPPGWPPATAHFKTDCRGRFTVNVVPGRYYLASLESRLGGYANIPLPRAYYPGVLGWQNATALIVEEGKMLEQVLYRLPDLGEQRRVEIQVMTEDGAPVRGAYVRDMGGDGIGRTASSGEPRETDAQGRVVYHLWSKCDYRFHADYFHPGRSHPWQAKSSDLTLPAGANPIGATIVLPGLRAGEVK